MSVGRVNPTEYETRRRISSARVWWVDPAPSIRTRTVRPGRDPTPAWSSAWRITVLWSAAVFDPALPGRYMITAASPEPVRPWSMNAHNGWWPKPFLNVGAASSFSEWAVTRVASTSMINGSAAER